MQQYSAGKDKAQLQLQKFYYFNQSDSNCLSRYQSILLYNIQNVNLKIKKEWHLIQNKQDFRRQIYDVLQRVQNKMIMMQQQNTILTKDNTNLNEKYLTLINCLNLVRNKQTMEVQTLLQDKQVKKFPQIQQTISSISHKIIPYHKMQQAQKIKNQSQRLIQNIKLFLANLENSKTFDSLLADCLHKNYMDKQAQKIIQQISYKLKKLKTYQKVNNFYSTSLQAIRQQLKNKQTTLKRNSQISQYYLQQISGQAYKGFRQDSIKASHLINDVVNVIVYSHNGTLKGNNDTKHSFSQQHITYLMYHLIDIFLQILKQNYSQNKITIFIEKINKYFGSNKIDPNLTSKIQQIQQLFQKGLHSNKTYQFIQRMDIKDTAKVNYVKAFISKTSDQRLHKYLKEQFKRQYLLQVFQTQNFQELEQPFYTVLMQKNQFPQKIKKNFQYFNQRSRLKNKALIQCRNKLQRIRLHFKQNHIKQPNLNPLKLSFYDQFQDVLGQLCIQLKDTVKNESKTSIKNRKTILLNQKQESKTQFQIIDQKSLEQIQRLNKLILDKDNTSQQNIRQTTEKLQLNIQQNNKTLRQNNQFINTMKDTIVYFFNNILHQFQKLGPKSNQFNTLKFKYQSSYTIKLQDFQKFKQKKLVDINHIKQILSQKDYKYVPQGQKNRPSINIKQQTYKEIRCNKTIDQKNYQRKSHNYPNTQTPTNIQKNQHQLNIQNQQYQKLKTQNKELSQKLNEKQLFLDKQYQQLLNLRQINQQNKQLLSKSNEKQALLNKQCQQMQNLCNKYKNKQQQYNQIIQKYQKDIKFYQIYYVNKQVVDENINTITKEYNKKICKHQQEFKSLSYEFQLQNDNNEKKQQFYLQKINLLNQNVNIKTILIQQKQLTIQTINIQHNKLKLQNQKTLSELSELKKKPKPKGFVGYDQSNTKTQKQNEQNKILINSQKATINKLNQTIHKLQQQFELAKLNQIQAQSKVKTQQYIKKQSKDLTQTSKQNEVIKYKKISNQSKVQQPNQLQIDSNQIIHNIKNSHSIEIQTQLLYQNYQTSTKQQKKTIQPSYLQLQQKNKQFLTINQKLTKEIQQLRKIVQQKFQKLNVNKSEICLQIQKLKNVKISTEEQSLNKEQISEQLKSQFNQINLQQNDHNTNDKISNLQQQRQRQCLQSQIQNTINQNCQITSQQIQKTAFINGQQLKNYQNQQSQNKVSSQELLSIQQYKKRIQILQQSNHLYFSTTQKFQKQIDTLNSKYNKLNKQYRQLKQLLEKSKQQKQQAQTKFKRKEFSLNEQIKKLQKFKQQFSTNSNQNQRKVSIPKPNFNQRITLDLSGTKSNSKEFRIFDQSNTKIQKQNEQNKTLINSQKATINKLNQTIHQLQDQLELTKLNQIQTQSKVKAQKQIPKYNLAQQNILNQNIQVKQQTNNQNAKARQLCQTLNTRETLGNNTEQNPNQIIEHQDVQSNKLIQNKEKQINNIQQQNSCLKYKNIQQSQYILKQNNDIMKQREKAKELTQKLQNNLIQLVELKNKMKILQEINIQRENKITQHQNLKQQFQQSIKQKNNLNQDSKINQIRLQKQISLLKLQIKKQIDQKTQLNGEITQNQLKIQDLSQKLKKTQTKELQNKVLAQGLLQIQQYKKKIQIIQQSNHSYYQNTQKLQTQIDTLKNKLNKQNRQFKSKYEQLKRQKQQIQAKLRRKENLHNELINKLQKNQQQYSGNSHSNERKVSLPKPNQTNNKISSSNSNESTTILELNKAKTQFKKLQKGYEEKIRNLQIDVKNSDQNIKNLLQKHKKQQQQLSQLKSPKNISVSQSKGQDIKLQFLLNDRFFSGECLSGQLQKKQQLRLQIQSSTQKKIVRSRLLYKFDLSNPTSFHHYIDNHPNLLLIIKTPYTTFGGFTSSILTPPKYQQTPQSSPFQSVSSKSFLYTFSPSNKIITYTLRKTNLQPIEYDQFFMIFGNSQIRIRMGQEVVYSNFGINNAYFDQKGSKVDALLGNGGKRETKVLDFQWYQIVFQK